MPKKNKPEISKKFPMPEYPVQSRHGRCYSLSPEKIRKICKERGWEYSGDSK